MSAVSWLAVLDGSDISWRPEPPYLTGDPDLVALLTARLAFDARIAVSPTGPFIEADISDPRAVLAALAELGGELRVSDGAPGVAVPLGAVA